MKKYIENKSDDLFLVLTFVFQAPARAFHLLWVNILAPYIFQPAPEDTQPQMTEKKQKKMERKMMRRR